MFDSVWPQRWHPTRLSRPWDSPGKNTGVGCHFLLQSMKVKSESEVAQSCPTLHDPMDCSLPGSSVYGIFPGNSTGVGCHCLLHTADRVEQTAGRLFKRKENFKLLTCEQRDKWINKQKEKQYLENTTQNLKAFREKENKRISRDALFLPQPYHTPILSSTSLTKTTSDSSRQGLKTINKGRCRKVWSLSWDGSAAARTLCKG